MDLQFSVLLRYEVWSGDRHLGTPSDLFGTLWGVLNSRLGTTAVAEWEFAISDIQ